MARKTAISILIALAMLPITYWASNRQNPIPFLDEKNIILVYEYATNFFSPTETHEIDSILLVNISHDRTLVPAYDNTGFVGNTPITDRKKLIEILEFLKAEDSYKYILLDVFFGKDYKTEHDSALFALIKSMDRIAIPCHSDEDLEDSTLLEKAGYADYFTSFVESDFMKYPYIVGKEGKSLPVKMYEETTGNSISYNGLIYHDGNRLARKCITLTYDLIINEAVNEDGTPNWYNLGADLLYDSIPGTAQKGGGLLYKDPQLSRDKYILIGSFQQEDIHNTIVGDLSGSIINFNAYLSLLNHRHIISPLFIFILFVIFFVAALLAISQKSLLLQTLISSLSKKHQTAVEKGIKKSSFIVSMIDYTVFFTFFCIVTYTFYHEIHDIFYAATVFSVIKNYQQIYNALKKILHMINSIKKSLASCLLLALSMTLCKGEKYQVMSVNSDKILIGKEKAVVGMTFDDKKDKIVWISPLQAFVARSVATGKYRRFFPPKRQRKSKVSHLSSRILNVSPNPHLNSDEDYTSYYLLDTLKLKASQNSDTNVCVKVKYVANKKEIVKPIMRDNEYIILPRDLFEPLSLEPFYIDITEKDTERDWEYYVYRNILIVPFPLKK